MNTQQSYAPQGIRATQSPRGQRPGFADPSAGDCMERNQPLAPPYAQGPTRTHAPPVAGRPVPSMAQRRLDNKASPALRKSTGDGGEVVEVIVDG